MAVQLPLHCHRRLALLHHRPLGSWTLGQSHQLPILPQPLHLDLLPWVPSPPGPEHQAALPALCYSVLLPLLFLVVSLVLALRQPLSLGHLLQSVPQVVTLAVLAAPLYKLHLNLQNAALRPLLAAALQWQEPGTPLKQLGLRKGQQLQWSLSWRLSPCWRLDPRRLLFGRSWRSQRLSAGLPWLLDGKGPSPPAGCKTGSPLPSMYPHPAPQRQKGEREGL